MKTIIKTTLTALALAAGASAGQAETVWHYPYKGAPYATQTVQSRKVPSQLLVRQGDCVEVQRGQLGGSQVICVIAGKQKCAMPS